MSKNYNPHSPAQPFTLESSNDESKHAAMIGDIRDSLHPEQALADDESDASDDSDSDTESE
jgi:hypothetical protein